MSRPNDDPERLFAGVTYARALGASHRLDESIRVGELTLSMLRRARTSEYSQTLTMMNNLARTYIERGDPSDEEKAVALMQEGMATTEGSGDTLGAVMFQYEQAAMLHKAGDYEAAASKYNQVIAALPVDVASRQARQLTLVTHNSLGFVHKDAGNFALAEHHMKTAVSGFRTMLGDYHSETLTSVNTLAHIYGDQFNFAEAIKCYEEVLAAPVFPPGLIRAVAEDNLQKCREEPSAAINGLSGDGAKLNSSFCQPEGIHTRSTGTYFAVTLPSGVMSAYGRGARFACIEAANLLLQPGTRVSLSGIATKPELNGQSGVVRSYDVVKDRYAVAVRGTKKLIGLTRDKCTVAGLRECDDAEMTMLLGKCPLAYVCEEVLSLAAGPVNYVA